MNNQEIRKAIEEAHLHHWEVAAALNIHEGTFCKMLRVELDAERKAAVMDAIKKLSGK